MQQLKCFMILAIFILFASAPANATQSFLKPPQDPGLKIEKIQKKIEEKAERIIKEAKDKIKLELENHHDESCDSKPEE